MLPSPQNFHLGSCYSSLEQPPNSHSIMFQKKSSQVSSEDSVFMTCTSRMLLKSLTAHFPYSLFQNASWLCTGNVIQLPAFFFFFLITECCKTCFSLPEQFSMVNLPYQHTDAYCIFQVCSASRTSADVNEDVQEATNICNVFRKQSSFSSVYSSSFPLSRIQIAGEVRQQDQEPEA